MMDITTLRIAATLVSFITFIGILAWAYSRRRESAFEAASRLPFEQD
jgi:cytochrome c oxidase cbb3-type subunit 4